jgi:ABC-type multidrug transport system fused ATPase/permease subunit
VIIVLDGKRIAEVESHEALVANGGQYAEPYAIQAARLRA